MPLYDFECRNEKCEKHAEHVETLCKVGVISECSECGEPMKKLIMAPDHKQVPHISWSTWRVGIGLNS